MKNQWNKIATETPPDLEYEAISIRVPQWEQKVAAFILERKPMKYYINEMPVLPEVIEIELRKGAYIEYVLKSDDWQRFLVPK
jgi:hypothetical protein